MEKFEKESTFPLKPVFYTLGIGLGLIVGYGVYRMTKNAIETNQLKVDDVKKEIIKNDVSYSDSDFSIMANNLFTAMDGWGTDEDLIYSVFRKLKTRSDFFKLVKTFGVKTISATGNGNTTGDLTSLLVSELGSSEQKQVQDILSKLNPPVTLWTGLEGVKTMKFLHLIPTNLQSSFEAKMKKICKELKIEPDWLMLIMYHESGLKPYITNSIGAVGLIQFMPATARGLGIEPSTLKQLNHVQQLDYVYKYYYPMRGQFKSFYDLYLYTFFPIAIGKPDDWVLKANNISAGSVAAANWIYDLNNDKTVQIKEFKKYLKDEYLIKKLNLDRKEIKKAEGKKINKAKILKITSLSLLGVFAVWGAIEYFEPFKKPEAKPKTIKGISGYKLKKRKMLKH